MPDHAATEEILRNCGVAFNSLHNGFYASTASMLFARSGARCSHKARSTAFVRTNAGI